MERNKTVSLCMIVKNEEKHLARCLDSVKELVDEMIVIDTGSEDKTVEIAKDFGAKVDYYSWDNNFSNARNYSLQQASGDWILLMDADDEFHKEDYDKFIELINTSTKDGHYFKTLSFAGEKKGNDVVLNLNLRLLRNNRKYHFIGAIHEQITRSDGTMDYKDFSTEDIRIFHYGYLTDVALEKNKRRRNISIIEEELKKDPQNSFHLFNLGNEYFALGDREKALELYDSAYRNFDYKVGFSSKLVIKRIMCLDEMGQYGRALEAIEEGLKVYPNFTDLEFERGWIHFKNKRYTLAIDSFKKCIELGKPPMQLEFLEGCGTYRPYEALGEIYFQLEDYHKAFECYENVLKHNPYLQRPLYRIGSILNKLYADKRYVSFRLSQYFNLEHVPNLLVIADVLLGEGLYDVAIGYLEKAKELDEKNIQINLMIGKTLFYQKQFSEALTILAALPKNISEYRESYKYIFLCYLVGDPEHVEDFLNKMEQDNDPLLYRIYSQLYKVYLGNEESVLSSEDNPEIILRIVMDILAELLKIREFHLFEKLLNVLNYINSNKVLLELAKIYYNHEFRQMAVSEILRSIKVFNSIDTAAIEILYKESINGISLGNKEL